MHKLKQGATFALPITVQDGKQPFDVSGHLIECRLNDSFGHIIEDLTVYHAVESNQFLLKSDNTAAWPLGCAVLDVKLSKDGNVTKSESFMFHVVKSETP